MDDLAQWLTTQLDEDERTMRATDDTLAQRNLRWSAAPVDDAFSKVKTATGNVVGTGEFTPEDAAHIAEHDPARVLREIDAKRRVLARHTPHVSGSPDCTMRCERSHPGAQVCNHDGYRWPCPDVRDLADCYTRRPGYLESWRP